MLDVSKPQKEKSAFSFKDYAFDILAAFIPASFIITAFQIMDIVGALIPIVSIFGGAYLVGKYRKKKGIKASKRNFLYVIALIILLIFVVPMIILSLTTDI